MKHRVIGLSGYAGSGKSEVSRYLTAARYTPLKFARPLKDMLRAFFRAQGVDDHTIETMVEGYRKEDPCDLLAGKSPRFAMQTLGTEWGRGMIGQDLWIDAAMTAARAVDGPVVFDDVRFENEAAAIREMGGVVVRVVRPGLERAHEHSSEALPEYDVTIVNDGKITDLHREIRTTL